MQFLHDAIQITNIGTNEEENLKMNRRAINEHHMPPSCGKLLSRYRQRVDSETHTE
jgi:hypothetical protein